MHDELYSISGNTHQLIQYHVTSLRGTSNILLLRLAQFLYLLLPLPLPLDTVCSCMILYLSKASTHYHTRTDLPFQVTVMGEGHVSDSKVVELSQSCETVVNCVPSLHSNQRSNVSSLHCIFYVCNTGGKLERLRVLLYKLPDHVYLVYEGPCGVFVFRVTRNPC